MPSPHLGSWASRRRAREQVSASATPEPTVTAAELGFAPSDLQAHREGRNWNARPPNWFQLGWREPRMDSSPIAAIYRCQSLIAESVAPVRLALEERSGKVWEEVESSEITRLMQRPNVYQTGAEFRLYMMLSLLSDGNAYAWVERNRDNSVAAFHPVVPGGAQVLRTTETGDVFYRFPVTGVDMLLRPETIPARDVWHLRARTTDDPLKGVSPLVATYWVSMLQAEMQQNSAEFFGNKSFPGGLLTTPDPLSQDQASNIRDSWERASEAGFQGKVAIADRGVKYQDLTVSAVDAALVEQYRLTVEEVARAFGVPGWKIGLGDPSYSNAETMDAAFTAETLRFYFDLIESSLGAFLRLPQGRRLNFQLGERMAKAEFTELVDGLTRAIQGGLLTPNEARARINQPPVADGDTLMVQQQMVPIERAVAEPEPIPAFGQPPVPVPDESEDEPEEPAA